MKERFHKFHTKEQSMKKKIDKLDSIKIKKYCSSKRHCQDNEIQATDWKKKFVNDIPNKRLVFFVLIGSLIT